MNSVWLELKQNHGLVTMGTKMMKIYAWFFSIVQLNLKRLAVIHLEMFLCYWHRQKS